MYYTDYKLNIKKQKVVVFKSDYCWKFREVLCLLGFEKDGQYYCVVVLTGWCLYY